MSLAPYLSVRFPEVISKLALMIHTDTHDGRRLVAIGCTEGVWIGYRHDSPCKFYIVIFLTMTYKNPFVAMSRVLHLKKVTQCAVLDDFGLFLVLADKVSLPFSILNISDPNLL